MAFTPEQLGNYLLLEKIAQGGMAQVFKAKTVDPEGTERLVVIKRILPHISSDPEYVQMLIDEAKIAVHFNHGNIAQIYDLGRIGDDYFIVMEYVDGKTLGQILREFKEKGKPIPLEIIAYCIAEMCQALDYMHRKTDGGGRALEVVHRDVSPQNIILSYSGNVKLIDFGVAKAVEKLSHTQSGILKGKFAYMSPEQADGDKLDNRSDIFSAGILLWELLTLERLYKRDSNKETLRAVRGANFIRPSRYRKDVTAELDAICEKALQRKKEKRYKRASDMAEDINRFLLKKYPEFRRVDVAKFLYKYFGPEPDEKDLEPELPELKIDKNSEPTAPPQEEETEVDRKAQLIQNLADARRKMVSVVGGIPFGKILILTAVVLLIMFGSQKAWHYWQEYRLATLELQVDPPDVDITVNGRKIKKEAGHYSLRLQPDKNIEIKVSKEGYIPQELSYRFQTHETDDDEITLEKDLPPFGTIKVETDPAEAIIYINDVEWHQKSPATIPQVKSGSEIKLGFFMEGYEFSEKKLTLKKGEEKNLKIKLQAKQAKLIIESQPSGAEVKLDGQIVGRTPFTDSHLLPDDKVDIEVSMPGLKTQEESLVLKAGENKLIFDLNKSEND